ncbi:hypothetical protein GVN21_10405 [Caulobacter sp. SLTY]|uniref:hypothetical protein n=1 Tax=Caulobacter sp. SLTY TaxID=2683262 RepID=UPI001411CED5|nr:hypothetical protein [Caulobacter sp. SLTY]NBB15765.1 hypothetical protein [Caulobacter sp. SLTY]
MVLVGTALFAIFLAGPTDMSATKVKAGSVARTDFAIGTPGKLDHDRIVCRKSTIGSRRDRKVCLTALEWTRIEDSAQRNLDTTLYGQGVERQPKQPKNP